MIVTKQSILVVKDETMNSLYEKNHFVLIEFNVSKINLLSRKKLSILIHLIVLLSNV